MYELTFFFFVMVDLVYRRQVTQQATIYKEGLLEYAVLIPKVPNRVIFFFCKLLLHTPKPVAGQSRGTLQPVLPLAKLSIRKFRIAAST